jgi:magnesium-transporting ATPase (P-type)
MMNPFTEVDWNPDRAGRRKFAVSLIIGFPVIAVIFSLITWLVRHAWKPFFLWLGAIGFAAGVVLWLLPQISKPFYLAWYFLACCMGFVVGNLVLSLFYFLIFTPIGLALRAAGRLSLRKQPDKIRTTYWSDAEKEIDSSRYYRQF